MTFKSNAVRPVQCFREGWALIKDQYLLIFVLTLVSILVAGLIPLGIMVGAAFCGLYAMMLKKMRGEPAEVDDLFKAIKFFFPGLVVTMFVVLPSLFLALPMIRASLGLMFAMNEIARGAGSETAVYGWLTNFSIFALLFTLVAGTLHAFVMFAYPLIAEHNLSGLTAFKLSARAVLANANGVILLILGEFLLACAGFLLFGIGVYLTVPLQFAAVAVAYRQVFPAEKFVNVAQAQ